ncbi:MAG: transcription initiation factor IIB family protein [Candidatus Micrarchaeota archaeon]|nr:transcription initiation factor IIB family protein [Candidatus Micrarchaeota archaeon]
MSQKFTQNHTLELHIESVKKGVLLPLIRDSTRGEEFCGTCGYVSPEKVEDKQATIFPDENGKVYLGGDNVLFGKTSTIDKSNKDAFGKPLSISVSQTMFRLKRWDNRITFDRHEVAVKRAYDRLSSLKTKANFSNLIMEESVGLYATLLTNKMLKGKPANLIVAACAYHVCKVHNVNTNLTSFAKSANVRPKHLFGAYRTVLEGMEELKLTTATAKQNPNENFLPPKAFLPAIAAKAGVPPIVEREALNILLVLEKFQDFVEGKDRNALVGSALYIACIRHNYICTQEELSAASSTSAVTLRKRYKQVRALVEQEENTKEG